MFEDGSRSDPADLRGLVEGHYIPDLYDWYASNTHERESSEVALRRELREELFTIGLNESSAFTDNLTFRSVRCVSELSDVHGLPYDFQYRHFTILELEPGLPTTASFTDQLAVEVGRTADLVLASADEITRGRTRKGDRIGPYSAYFFGTRRNRHY